MLSTLLWLVWVVACVAAAMSSKRALQVLEEQRTAPSEAQMVGVPVEDELPTGTVVGVATPSLQGVPIQGNERPSFQGMPVTGPLDGVCQGMPVRDDSGNVSRPAGAPKEV